MSPFIAESCSKSESHTQSLWKIFQVSLSPLTPSWTWSSWGIKEIRRCIISKSGGLEETTDGGLEETISLIKTNLKLELEFKYWIWEGGDDGVILIDCFACSPTLTCVHGVVWSQEEEKSHRKTNSYFTCWGAP